ncbi:MAG TPA: radical SAM protein [Syntrophobacteraceae bacterium]|nr:radical SAM protein [Syntrophobacteraceae bacterium]
MYDPVKRAFEIARIVSPGEKRKYARFRAARFYGGIATADCVGCCLQCVFCWFYEGATKPHTVGELYSPEKVAHKLIGIAGKKGFDQVRISGSEPTLCKEHLLRVLDLIPEKIDFILETNGILIGYDEDYAKALARHENLHVRVSLKGTNEEEFSRLTGAEPIGFGLQLKGLENLVRAGASTHAAAMVSFSPPGNIQTLQARLARIGKELEEIEIEELVFFNPGVEERLRKAGIGYRTAYRRDNIPPEQV